MIALLLSLLAAPALPYGDRVELAHWSGPLALEPARAGGIAELTLAAAAFEGLYAIDPRGEVVPRVATALPVERDGRWVIPLAAVALHDGRRLTAEQVAIELSRWAQPRSPAAHLVLPIAGARARLGGRREVPLDVEILAEENALSIVLAEPCPEWPRLLASLRAGLALTPRGGERVPIGSGPFRLEAPRGDELRLTAFAEHRLGRPFLDALVLVLPGSPFGVRNRIAPGGLGGVLDVPDESSAARASALAAPGAAPHEELLFLSIGDRLPALGRTELLRAIEGAVGRERLARRYAGPDARAAETLTGARGGSRIISAPPSSAGRTPVTLLLPRRYPTERRFAERVQLDLHRAGITVTLETIEDGALEARRRSGDYELLLERFALEGSAREDPVHHLHALLALAAARGVLPAVVTPGELAAFSNAGSAAARWELISRLDRKLRDEARLVPLIHRTPSVWIDRTLLGARRTAGGALVLEDAFFGRGVEW